MKASLRRCGLALWFSTFAVSCTGRTTVTTAPAADAAPPAAISCDNGLHQVGDSWKDDCNTCNCREDGLVACTRVLCDASTNQPAATSNAAEPTVTPPTASDPATPQG